MAGQIIEVLDDVVTVQVAVQLSGHMLDMESAIQDGLNEAGRLLTLEALKNKDTDGSPIKIGDNVWRSKGQLTKRYQTSYGEVEVPRHVYQKSGGGKTYCPMEQNARLVMNTTPFFAKQISSKFARNAPRDVQCDLHENHGRKVSVSFLQNLSNMIASVVQAREEKWSYHVPKLDAAVKTIAVSLDGTCMLMCENGWREAMAGSLSLYDGDGERLHSIYIGAAPEYGKEKFLNRLTREIDLLKERYPNADYVGIADGAKCNWTFLEKHTETHILDFYHASGYLGAVAKALYPTSKTRQKKWLEENCSILKHDHSGSEKLYQKMCDTVKNRKGLSRDVKEGLIEAVTYFENQKHRMKYADFIKKKYPIGSGVIEAACKTLIKQRLCQAGMRWKETGAASVLSLRSLILTKSRWQQFWNKVSQYGFPIAENT